VIRLELDVAQTRLAQAVAHRGAARYRDALELLEGCEDWHSPHAERGVLLRATILSRTKPLESLAILARCQDLFESDEARFGYCVVSMRDYIVTRNFDAASEMAVKAEALADRVPAPQRSTLWYQHALLAYCLGNYDTNHAGIRRLLENSDPNGRFLGYLTRAYMHASRQCYDEQTSDLIAAVDVALNYPGECDPALLAVQVHALLRLGLERGHREAVAKAADAVEVLPWTDDLRGEHFLCVRALAWDAFLRGDAVQAQWMLKDSKALAVSDAWKVMAHLDRAYIARMNGNEYWAAEDLAAAHAIARDVEWGSTAGEERQALVMLAVLYSPTDMARAQEYVSLYVQLGRENLNPMLQAAHDQRSVAFEQYALGRVQQVLGNEELAAASFRRAYDIFDAARYHFRAALCALGLYESSSEADWRQKAREHADHFPNSALCATLARSHADAAPSRTGVVRRPGFGANVAAV